MSLSKNGVGLILFALSFVGVSVTETQLVEVMAAVMQIVSFVLLIWNQVTRPDVVNFFFKQ